MSSLAPSSPLLLENDSHLTLDFPKCSLDFPLHGTTAERCPLQARPWSGSDVSCTSDIGRFQQEYTAIASTFSPSSPVVEWENQPTQTAVDTDLYLDISTSSSSDPVVNAPLIDTGITKRPPAPATTPFPINNIQILGNTTQFHVAQIPVSQCSHVDPAAGSTPPTAIESWRALFGATQKPADISAQTLLATATAPLSSTPCF
jgi:hypothetical protein